MKKTLLILITLCITAIGYSQTFTDNFITYNVITSNTVETSDYDYTNGGATVNIPTTVDYNSVTYNVTSIGNLTFYTDPTIGEYITNLTFTLPSNIISIGENAFNGNHLTNVTIPDSVISIGNQAFIFNNLTNVIIGNTVEIISGNAFRNNDLTNITIPGSVTSIGNSAFSGNNLLTCVISEAITPPTIATGANDTFLNLRSNINLSIPTGTASAYAATQWTGFNSVAEGLTGTFVVDNITYQINATSNNEVTVTDYNTAGGTVVDIPATVVSGCTEFSVTDIGNNAFSQKNIFTVNIPNTVITIGDGAFEYNPLSVLILPNSINSIGVFAFRDNNLNDITFSTSLTTINSGIFFNNNLSNVIIPDNITSISNDAFKANTSLSSITLPNNLISVGNSSFQNCNIEVINLPNSLTSIGNSAFRYNDIISITIPENVTSIGTSAFVNNPLTGVFSNSFTPPTITTINNNNDSFASDRSNIHLHIPSGTTVMDAYVNDAGALWTGFNPVTQDALSTSDFELANDIKIITTTGEIKVTFSNNVRLQNYAIYSVSGVKVTTGTESRIPTTYLATGIYILKLDFDKGVFAKKIAVY